MSFFIDVLVRNKNSNQEPREGYTRTRWRKFNFIHDRDRALKEALRAFQETDGAFRVELFQSGSTEPVWAQERKVS